MMIALALGAGCSGGNGADSRETAVSELPQALLDSSWQLAYPTEASLAPFASQPAWASFVMQREYREAISAFGPQGGAQAARVHTEAAFLYRQTALITAYSLIEVYGKTPEPTDPVGVAHLLAVSYAITGQLDAARAESHKLDALADDPTLAWHAPWKAWLDKGEDARASWPESLLSAGLLSVDPVKLPLPEPAPGLWPEIASSGELPHYALPEREGSTASRAMGDPGALVALALWHDAAANAASPEGAAMARSMRAGYTLPIEPIPAKPSSAVSAEMLFGSDVFNSADVEFLADLMGEAGAAAVETYADRSVIAWLAKRASRDGMFKAEYAIDEVALLRPALERAAVAKAGGEELSHHGTFANLGAVGALRSLALVAERQGDREASGLLRINAFEQSDRERACPVGLLALAAWDASNRYPMRAQDILHNHARHYPSIEIARYGLDVLALRVGSERVETPGM